jgi:NitT/TauT family transport system ATP-binding protein
MVFQDYTSFDNRTVEDNVAFGLECRGVPARERRERAREWIARVGLDVGRDATKFPSELSGGMRQRVAFLRTLVAGKPVLALDEPFASLDAITRAEMQEWLAAALETEPRTIVLVTHDVEEALYLADRVAVLSARPTHVVEELEAPAGLARAGDRDAAVTDPAFVAARERALHALHRGAR